MIAEIMTIYTGSNGDATKALYARLDKIGPLGIIAVNLFRACKCSERAKVYRGGGYRRMAYDRKEWSVTNLCTALTKHAASAGIIWGWKLDPKMSEDDPYKHVLYVEIPTGQISFHGPRGAGPEYEGEWDRAAKTGPERICRWVAQLLEERTAA